MESRSEKGLREQADLSEVGRNVPVGERGFVGGKGLHFPSSLDSTWDPVTNPHQWLRRGQEVSVHLHAAFPTCSLGFRRIRVLGKRKAIKCQ